MNREIVGGGGASVYPLTGDVTSTAGNAPVSVTGLRGIPIGPGFPTGGEVLTYDGPTNTLLLETPAPTLELQTNGVDNSTQTLLNLADSASVTITETAGTITFTATGGGGGITRSAITTNADGNYFIWSDGLIEQWGMVIAAATGAPLAATNITFPTPFTIAVGTIQVTLQGLPHTGSNDVGAAQVDNLSLTTAGINLQASVPTGGGGQNFDNATNVYWYARGI